jgi:hypothetical protein
MEKVIMIKHDALIKIEVGAGFMKKLQELLVYLSIDLSLEEIEEYKRQIESGEEFTEDWMKHVTTLSSLLKDLESKAEQQGFTYEADLPLSLIHI